MQRLAFAALVLAACGTTDDERPRNLDYITEAILAPSCGEATCHSAFRQAGGKNTSFVFDTIEGARGTFQKDPTLVGFQAEDPLKIPGLYLNLTIEQPGAPRMPYTYPLPDVDVELIKEWLQAGAPGVCVTGSTGCLGPYVMHCVDAQTRDTPRVVEKGAYDTSEIAKIGAPTGPRNCVLEGKVCHAGDCQ